MSTYTVFSSFCNLTLRIYTFLSWFYSQLQTLYLSFLVGVMPRARLLGLGSGFPGWLTGRVARVRGRNHTHTNIHIHTRSLNTMPSFMSIFGEMQLVPSVRRLKVERTRPVTFSNAKMPPLDIRRARPIPNCYRVLILPDINNLCTTTPETF